VLQLSIFEACTINFAFYITSLFSGVTVAETGFPN